MTNKIGRVHQKIKRDGFRAFLSESFRRAINAPNQTHLIKQRIFNLVTETYGNEIAFGPFKGMRLNPNPWWGQFDQITKILGVYEKEICATLHKFLARKKDTHFVDIGAADGYYAVGASYSKAASNVFAFEISDQGRQALKNNAAINNCLDKISIQGEASYQSLKSIFKPEQNYVVMVDIEGGEYGLLTDDVLELMRNSYLIIELHPFFVKDGHQAEALLLERAQKWFDISISYREVYDPNSFEVFNDLSDDERLLAFSEGREKNPKWLVLEPKGSKLPN